MDRDWVIIMAIRVRDEEKVKEENSSSVLDAAGSTVMSKSKATWTATLGLVVHAAADGIALGAASAGSRFNVEMIVFMAIMLHKVRRRKLFLRVFFQLVRLGAGSLRSRFVSHFRRRRSQTHSSTSAGLLLSGAAHGHFHLRYVEKCSS